MRLMLRLFLLVCGPAAAREVTDSAGRVVEVPDRVERVFAAGPPAAILL
jgi:iron complex transport system substrate-binding protein